MSNGEMQPQLTEAPQTHTLRVAVFDFHSGELLSRHGNAPLLQDVQPVDERGFPGISHEQRAINVASRQFLARLALKTMGRVMSVSDEEGVRYQSFAVKTSTPVPASLIRQSLYTGSILKRRSLDDVYSAVHESLQNDPQVAGTIDRVDALALDEASKLFKELADYRR